MNDKFDSLDIKFNELKNEMKLGHNHLIKKRDKLITKLDENLNLVESQFERQKVKSSTQQNAVLDNNIFKNNNSSNECTDNSNITSSKIVVLEKDKNDNESIMNDNEIFKFMKSERKLRESILVQGVQGVEFSFDVVLGGEDKSSCNCYKDKNSFNLYLVDERCV